MINILDKTQVMKKMCDNDLIHEYPYCKRLKNVCVYLKYSMLKRLSI